MLDIDVDLGHALLQSRKSVVCVELRSLATFAASEKDDIDQLRRTLTAKTLADQEHGMSRPWIRCGDNFKLVLSVQAGPVLGVREQDELKEVLSSRLRKAKMWQQLHLTPASIHNSSDDVAGGFIVTTHLAHANLPSTAKPRFHKLRIDVPYHDTRPPPGVIDIPCKTVHMKVSLSQQQRRRKRKRRNDEVESPGPAASKLRHEDADSPPGLSAGDDFVDILEDDYAYMHDRDGLFEQDEGIFNGDAESEGNMLEVALSPTDELSELSNQASERSKLSPLELQSKEPECESEVSPPDINECLQAIEAALKVVTTGTSCRNSNGFSTKKGCSIYPWSAIAPAIWSPNYLPSVAKRVVFIPTISHAISSVLDGPNSKISEHSSILNGDAQVPELPIASVSAIVSVSARIWDHVQIGCTQETAARKLSLLSEAADGGDTGHGTLDELLHICRADCDNNDIVDVADHNHVSPDFCDETTEVFVEEPSLGPDRAADTPFDALADDPEDLDDEFYFDIIDLPANDQLLGTNEPRGDLSSIPDDRLDLAEAEARSTWQGGESKLISTSGRQSSSMSSQSLHGLARFTSCNAKHG